MASGLSWERPSCQRYFGVSRKQLDALREVVRETLDGKVLTRDELIAAVIARRGYGHLGGALRPGWGTLLKPYAWQGDLCFGPSRGDRVALTRPEGASSAWAGPPSADEAAVSKQSGWISPIVVAGGIVKGTWDRAGDEVRVDWFKEAGPPPRSQIKAEVARLSSILDRSLSVAIVPK